MNLNKFDVYGIENNLEAIGARRVDDTNIRLSTYQSQI